MQEDITEPYNRQMQEWSLDEHPRAIIIMQSQ